MAPSKDKEVIATGVSDNSTNGKLEEIPVPE